MVDTKQTSKIEGKADSNSANPGAILSEETKRSKSAIFDISSRGGKAKVTAGGGLALLVLIFFLVLSSGGTKAPSGIQTLDTNNLSNSSQPTNNNSSGYTQSGNGQFSQLTLDVNYALPTIIKSQNYEVNLAQQISWQDGFAILAATMDRDYRPASEFMYKAIAESGDELVRVNFVIGNATDVSIPIGYNDLQLYSITTDGIKTESERINEDLYSPKDGQTLGGRKTQNVSLHYRVKRGAHIDIVKTKTIDQKNANKSKGEEKFPVLNLKINLP